MGKEKDIELWRTPNYGKLNFFGTFSFKNGFWFPISIKARISSPRGYKKRKKNNSNCLVLRDL